tara:strand:- start:3345 stop:6059 length:2715 start_codon:yes stop_codon:yes gene_type:complete
MIQPQIRLNTGRIDNFGLVVDDWYYLDLGDSASISIKDSIKKAKDVGKVFTSFTNPFTLPATKNNNKAFKRFSSSKVQEGFDPRKKYEAIITLNGVDFKKGYLKLNHVEIVKGLPMYYKTQFFGELSSVKDTLSDSKLRDLDQLALYNIELNDENVQIGLESGFDVLPYSDEGIRSEWGLSVTSATSSSGTTSINIFGNDYDIYISATSGGSTSDMDRRNEHRDQIASVLDGIDGIGHSGSAFGDASMLIWALEAGANPMISYDTMGLPDLSVSTSLITEGSDEPPLLDTPLIVPNSKGMFKFPLLSHTRGFEYTDSQGFHRMLTSQERADDYQVVSSDRLTRFDLKPAIKLETIIDAIEYQFPNIKFNRDWIFGGIEARNPTVFDELYLWMHSTKGFLSYGDGEKFVFERIVRYAGGNASSGEWTLLSNYPELRPFNNPSGLSKYYTGSLRVSSMLGAGNIELQVYIYKNGSSEPYNTFIQTGSAEDDDVVCDFYFPFDDFPDAGQDYGSYYLKTRIIADDTIGEFAPELLITINGFDTNGQYSLDSKFYANTSNDGPVPTIDVISNIVPNLLMPEYKIIDMLSDLFKMFNLVSYENRKDDGTWEMKIESLDYFLDRGKQVDITPYVKVDKGTVSRIAPYSLVEYKFSEPKTFLAINQKELTGDDFGSVTFNVNNFTEGGQTSNSLLFDGGTYKVEPKVEKMMYERMTAQPSGLLTGIQWGWFVNDNKRNVPEPTIGKPLWLFCVNSPTLGFNIEWEDGHVSGQYVRPSNVSSSETRFQTIHFNAEFNEYDRDINYNSLFELYHSRYINSIYSPYAKRLKMTAILPPLIFINLKLNDQIVYNNTSYTIDQMSVNIISGEVKFDLLRITDEYDVFKRTEPSDKPNTNWEDINTNWENINENWEI